MKSAKKLFNNTKQLKNLNKDEDVKSSNKKSTTSGRGNKNVDLKVNEIIALSSSEDDDDAIDCRKGGDRVTSSQDVRKLNQDNPNQTNRIATLIINDSESDSLQSQSSSQNSENYEAEDENETEKQNNRQQKQLLTSLHTQQQLQQVQRFLKSFDTNNIEMEKTAISLNELRNFRQAPKYHIVDGDRSSRTTKLGKFNISTKFLRKPRNKLKTSHHQQYVATTTTTTLANIDYNINNKNCNSSSNTFSNNNSNNNNNNNDDEFIGKLKDFSIDSLLNH